MILTLMNIIVKLEIRVVIEVRVGLYPLKNLVFLLSKEISNLDFSIRI